MTEDQAVILVTETELDDIEIDVEDIIGIDWASQGEK